MLVTLDTVIDAQTSLVTNHQPASGGKYLCFQAVSANTTICLRTLSEDFDSFEISADGSYWNTWYPSTNGSVFVDFRIVLLNVGDCVFIRAFDSNQFSHTKPYGAIEGLNNRFYIYGYAKCFGNIMSLVDKTCTKKYIEYDYQFFRLFASCKGLVSAPELPATILANHCYQEMFMGCTNLVTAPELPAMTLMDYCYAGMFQDCASLVTAPELPATTLAHSCYSVMFSGCKSLVSAPELPAMTMVDGYCYNQMFYGCTSLVAAPELPATKLAGYCYQYMFRGCTSLVSAPVLPATTLTDGCYGYMFQNCTKLTGYADIQNVNIMGTESCNSMYDGCTSLSAASTPNISTWQTSYFPYWLQNVSPTGILYAPTELRQSIPIGSNGIPSGWTFATPTKTITLSSVGPENLSFTYTINGNTATLADNRTVEITLTYSQNLSVSTNSLTKCIFVNDELMCLGNNNTINYNDIPNHSVITCSEVSSSGDFLRFKASENSVCNILNKGTNSGSTKPLIYYSFDKNSWTLVSGGSQTTINIQSGQTIYFMGLNKDGISRSTSNYTTIGFASGSVYAAGDVTSLLNVTGKKNNLTSYSFFKLFSGSTALITSPELPAMVLASYCYQSMFQGCTSLVSAPVLPAMKMESFCCYGMFQGCTSLVTPPELPAKAVTTCCYQSMFQGCTSLVSAPVLPAITVSNAGSCYQSMFMGCTSLAIAPRLPATTLANNCYSHMFQGCTSLVTAPELPATALKSNCYAGMFLSCTNLVTAPELPATALAGSCYQSMFQGCTSLKTPPELPASASVTYCYSQMFNGCTSLLTAPELPATTLAIYCYYGMFQGCTSLVSAPELPATTLANGCYSNMFQGCSKLNYIECYADTLSDTYSQNWVIGVASAGTFVKAVGATLPVGNNGVPTNWVLINGTELFSFQAGNTSSSIALTTPTGLSITLETSSDGVNWASWIKNSSTGVFVTKTLQSGETIYIRGNNTKFVNVTNSTNSSRFLFTGNTYCRGNIMYLLDKTGTLNSLAGKTYCFFNLFSGATTLITPPELPSTTLASYCYGYMFDGCTSLVTAPELPATTLADNCYSHMFNGCTSLVTAPELPATALTSNCYQNMFYGCSNLVSAPELPAMTLTDDCYHSMFRNCTSLTTAPELPATTLADVCYAYMFYGCSNLVSAPKLPATALASRCYLYMFGRCSSLVSAPELPAMTLTERCYNDMFRYCTNLNYVKVGALSWDTSCTTDWLGSVSSIGDFYKPANTTIGSGVDGIPSGWTIHNI